jgi:hypothetical protein
MIDPALGFVVIVLAPVAGWILGWQLREWWTHR